MPKCLLYLCQDMKYDYISREIYKGGLIKYFVLF
jgi:hypothetical protein